MRSAKPNSKVTSLGGVPQPRTEPRTSILQNGPLPTVLRAAWLLVAFLSIGFFIAGVPYRYQQLQVVCAGAECAFGQLPPDELVALENMGVSTSQFAAYDIALSTIMALLFTTVAFVIFWRRSREWMALMVSLWLVTLGTMFGEVGNALAANVSSLQPFISFVSDLGAVFLLPLFLLIFPDGRFVPRWTRWVFLIYVLGGLISGAIAYFVPSVASSVDSAGILIWVTIQLTGVGAQIYRYRRVSSPFQRQQTKWVVFGLSVVVLGLFLLSILQLINLPFSQPDQAALFDTLLELTLPTLIFLVIPLTIGLSILRYRLWDIDLIINRTLVYSLLSAVLASIYLGTVILLQTIITAVSGQESPVTIVISTLVIAALFTPLRTRVQNFIDRRFYRRKYDAEKTLSAFAEMARDEVDLALMTSELLRVVEKTMQPESVSLWLKKKDKVISQS